MLASEYKNCFWNASGELACLDSKFYGYLGQNNDYPNWKLYTGVQGAGVEGYNPKGYQTAYETAHTGSTTLDHYYQPHANYNYGSSTARMQGSGSCTSCSYPSASSSPRYGVQQGGACNASIGMGRRSNPNLEQQYNYQYCTPQQWPQKQWPEQPNYQDPSRYDRRYGGSALDLYPNTIYDRPNSHTFGGSGWGDAQIMAEASASTVASTQAQEPQYFQQSPSRQGYSYHALNPEYVSPHDTSHAQAGGYPHAREEGAWRTSRNQAMIPTHIPDYFEREGPGYGGAGAGAGAGAGCTDCASPDPRYLTGSQNITAKEQYNTLLGKYGTDPQFAQFQNDRAQYGTAYDQNMATRQGYPVQSLYGQGFSSQNQQIMSSSQGGGAFANYDSAFTNNSILGNQSGGAPSYAMLMMQERPFLNPNPYAGNGSLLGQGNLYTDQPIYIPSQVGADGYGCNGGQQLAPYMGSNSHNSNNSGSYYGQGQGLQSYGTGQTYYDCPGGHLLRSCDAKFRDKVTKIVKEIGRPQGVSGKNGLKVVWKGARLNKHYRNTFHRIYLVRDATYPVITVIRTTIPPEDVSKLRFISDRFRIEGDTLILRGPTLKSNLAKMALACMAMRRKVTYCSIYDNQLGQKWVWALNPKSPMYKAGAKREYLRVLRESCH